jgi:cbb3-type cytochrome oxidase subunit 1
MSLNKHLLYNGALPELISAHTHIILVGSVMMMIMGVALWFFPRAEKNDKKYNPELIVFTYWTLTISTALRFVFQIINAFSFLKFVDIGISIFSIFQVIAILIFFYAMWGRIRAVGSQYREAKGEKF